MALEAQFNSQSPAARKAAFFVAVSICALALPGCGGEDLERPSGGPAPALDPIDYCARAQDLEFQNIVNFERPFSSSAPCDPALDCQASPLYFNYDLANSVDASGQPPGAAHRCPPNSPGVETDPSGSTSNPSSIPEGERCGNSQSALRIYARNISTCYSPLHGRLGWGGSYDITVSGDALTDFHDASDWDGVSLWVKRGNAGQSLIFSVVDRENLGVDLDPSDELHCGCREVLSADGSSRIVCSSDPGLEFRDEEKCDPFGAAIALTADWSLVLLPFASLRQKGFGVPSSLGQVDSSQIKRLQLLIGPGDWDFWIDDVAFYRTRP